MSQLPPSWSATTLKTVANLITGNTPSTKSPEFYGGTIPFVKPGDLDCSEPINITEQQLTELGAKQSRLVRAGATLVSCIGNLGKIGFAGVPLATNQQINSAEFYSGFVDDRYGYYLCKTLKPWMERESSATTIAILNKGKFGEAPVPLAPIAEQKRIADKLDIVLTRVDAVNTRLARVSPLLKRFRQSVLAAATSGRLTEEWRATAPAQSSAIELAQYLVQRAKKEKKPPAQPDMAHWKKTVPTTWTIASVHQFAECLDRLRVPIKRDQRQSELGLYPYYGANGEVGRIDQFIFDDELVLVTEDETFYGREKPIAYRSSGKCWVNNHAHVLRAPSKAANDYLCFSLMYYDVIPWLSGTTGRAKLTQQALNALPIAVPPALEIDEIVRRVETLFAFADRLEARLQAAQTAADRLTPSLLAKAFRGELVPQDPNDEPAAELLRRLQTDVSSSSTKRGKKISA
mgnify:CR=1 FL=1